MVKQMKLNSIQDTILQFVYKERANPERSIILKRVFEYYVDLSITYKSDYTHTLDYIKNVLQSLKVLGYIDTWPMVKNKKRCSMVVLTDVGKEYLGVDDNNKVVALIQK